MNDKPGGRQEEETDELEKLLRSKVPPPPKSRILKEGVEEKQKSDRLDEELREMFEE